MATTYTKSLATDFGGSIEPAQFDTEIKTSSIAQNLQGVTIIGDDVNITFTATLSTGDQTILDGLVSSHMPITGTGDRVLEISLTKDSIDLPVYHPIKSFNFLGTNKLSNITHMKIVGSMDLDGTDYSVRVWDVTNHNSICSATFSNITDKVNDLSILSNLPTGEAIFEVQMKVNGMTKAIVTELLIYYD